MSGVIKIYLELSIELEEVLSDNGITIAEILDRQEVEVNGVIEGIIPYNSEKGSRTKDITTIILAGSAAIMSIGFAISQVLHEIYMKPFLVEIYENEELRDADGNILTDEKGNPILMPVKRYEFFEPKGEHKKRELDFSFGLKNGIVIKVKSEENNVLEYSDNIKHNILKNSDNKKLSIEIKKTKKK